VLKNSNGFDALQTCDVWEFVVMQHFLLKNNFYKQSKKKKENKQLICVNLAWCKFSLTSELCITTS